MFRLRSLFVLGVLFGCTGKAGSNDGAESDESFYISASEVQGLQAPRVLAQPPEIEPPGAWQKRPSSVNGNLPERPKVMPETTASPEAKPDAEPWAPNSPLYEIFKEDVSLNGDSAGGAP